jgi:hypothetical protein
MAMAEDLPGIYTSGGDLLIRAPGEAKFNRMKFDQVSSDDLERSNQQIAKHVNTFGNDLDALEKSDTSITAGIAKAKSAVPAVEALDDAVKALSEKTSNLIADTNKNAADEAAAFSAALAKAHEKLVDELDEKFGALKDTLSDNKAAIDAKINKQVVAAEKTSSELEEAATDILERIEAHEDCMKDGLVYNENKNRCFEVDQDASKMIGKVWHRMFNNEDSREGGWLNERYIKFTKALDDTYLRVVYYDNFRVHGHLSHGKWHVMFCDANGNGCAECNDPGQIGMWKWARHQGNWWMNDHIHGSVTGMCRRSENRQLRKGEYQVRIYLDQARYDVHTGSSGGNHIMVDEVVKY